VARGRKPISLIFDGRPCCYCKRKMDMGDVNLCPTRDHYPVPRARGGRRTLIACSRCNVVKMDMSAPEWQAFMHQNPEWWNLTLREINERRREVRVELAKHMRPPDFDEKIPTAIGDQLTALGIVRRIAEDFDKVFPKEKE
jgi:hypothetical protein